MTFGGILALLVLAVCIVALVFQAAAPGWLPLVLTATLALAVLLSGYPVRLGPPAA